MKKFFSIVISVIIALSVFAVPVYADDEIYDIAIEMQIGQNESLVNGVISVIDENDNVVPFIENGRTLVPGRAISEGFDAYVNWNENLKTATIIGTATLIPLNHHSRILKSLPRNVKAIF